MLRYLYECHQCLIQLWKVLFAELPPNLVRMTEHGVTNERSGVQYLCDFSQTGVYEWTFSARQASIASRYSSASRTRNPAWARLHVPSVALAKTECAVVDKTLRVKVPQEL